LELPPTYSASGNAPGGKIRIADVADFALPHQIVGARSVSSIGVSGS